MKIAHVRERHGPAGEPWRLAAALDDGETPTRWLDVEVARRRSVAADPRRAHNASLYRQPLTTLDDLLMRGLRIDTLRELVEPFEPRDTDDPAILEAAGLSFGPPVLQPPSLRDFYAFEGHVRTMWERRGGDVPETWYRLPIFYFSNASEIRGPDDPIWSPARSVELDYELEVAAVVDTAAVDLPADRAEETIGGYTIFNDWSARDLQREETVVRLGPAKGKDFASSFGPYLVTPDELAGARTGTGYDLAMTAHVNGIETSRGRWADAQFSFGDMLARASADVHLRPGDLIGSGTVGTGCLLEVKDSTLGRYLEPGDVVELRIEPMTADDWAEVKRIYAEGIATGDATLERETPDFSHFDRSHRRDCRLVARQEPNGPVLGWTALTAYSSRRVYAGVAWESVYVAASARGQGVGRALLEALIPAAEASGLWTLLAGVLLDNKPSLALHVAVGFRRVGVQRRLGRDATGRWRDVVLLERRSEALGRD